jgi:hypothetical protein
MALYTFFLRRRDGDATSFEVHDLTGDEAAADHAAHVGAQHASAAYVEVFAGDRAVLTLPGACRSA